MSKKMFTFLPCSTNVYGAVLLKYRCVAMPGFIFYLDIIGGFFVKK